MSATVFHNSVAHLLLLSNPTGSLLVVMFGKGLNRNDTLSITTRRSMSPDNPVLNTDHSIRRRNTPPDLTRLALLAEECAEEVLHHAEPPHVDADVDVDSNIQLCKRLFSDSSLFPL
jgi:hypothetical protein